MRGDPVCRKADLIAIRVEVSGPRQPAILQSAPMVTRPQCEDGAEQKIRRCITLPTLQLVQLKYPSSARQNQLFQSHSIPFCVAPEVHP